MNAAARSEALAGTSDFASHRVCMPAGPECMRPLEPVNARQSPVAAPPGVHHSAQSCLGDGRESVRRQLWGHLHI